MSAFDEAFDYTIGNEGGYSNDTNDSGGPTNWGIIQSEYSRWLGRQATIADMKAMTKDQAKPIYKRNYWLPMHLDLVSSTQVCIAIFDQAVNRGIGWPPKRIQQIIGVTVDGIIGPETIRVLNAFNPNQFITEFEKLCEASYQDIVVRNPSQKVFLNGWIRRAKRLLTLLK